ncbi:MAG: hypothetical protein ACTSPB_15680 [Candidatus Thorarchaeota archaeon]
MASVVVEADTSPKTAFTTPTNKIGKIKLLEIDNQSASDITITIQDVFTPTATAGNPSPSEVTVDRKVITVKTGESYTEKIDGYIEILGKCNVVANTADSTCKITIGYEFE